jgi:hypothetical protein
MLAVTEAGGANAHVDLEKDVLARRVGAHRRQVEVDGAVVVDVEPVPLPVVAQRVAVGVGAGDGEPLQRVDDVVAGPGGVVDEVVALAARADRPYRPLPVPAGALVDDGRAVGRELRERERGVRAADQRLQVAARQGAIAIVSKPGPVGGETSSRKTTWLPCSPRASETS